VAELVEREAELRPDDKPTVNVNGIEELVTDKGYHSGTVVQQLKSYEVRSYIPERNKKDAVTGGQSRGTTGDISRAAYVHVSADVHLRVSVPSAPGVSRLLCKRPSFVLGDGVWGRGQFLFPSLWQRRCCRWRGIHGWSISGIQGKVLHNLPLSADPLHHNQVLSKMNYGAN
jgi:hypothetical protein